jgi:hypothetical protein
VANSLCRGQEERTVQKLEGKWGFPDEIFGRIKVTRPIKLVSIISFLLLVFLRTALAADASGTWKGEMSQGGNITFTVNAKGESLTGAWIGTTGKECPIKDGKLKGDAISFAVVDEWQGQPITLLVKGTVSGNEMRLQIDADNGSWGTSAVVKKQ